MGRCIVCGHRARLITMPLIGRAYWLCRIHGLGRMIATMRALVAHG